VKRRSADFLPYAGAVLLLGALVAACSPVSMKAGVGLPPAMLYEDATVPLTVNVDKERPWRTNTDPSLPSSRVSTRQVQLNLPFIAPGPSDDLVSVGWGSMSIDDILAQGDLERVTYADARKLTILGIYHQLTIIAYGPAKGSEETGPPPGVTGRPPEN